MPYQASPPCEVGEKATVLVAVDGTPSSRDALEWAAAEAEARGCALRVVHAFKWPSSLDGHGGANVVAWMETVDAANRIVDEAAASARTVAPSVGVSTHVHVGSFAARILEQSRQSSLLVIGRRQQRGLAGSLVGAAMWQGLRSVTCPVIVAGLFDSVTRGPSACRVVVGAGGMTATPEALGFAFAAAHRRGVGLTVVHALPRQYYAVAGMAVHFPGTCEFSSGEAGEAAVSSGSDRFPGVHVRHLTVAGPIEAALASESVGAALVVFETAAAGRLRTGVYGASTHGLLRAARCPVALLRLPYWARQVDDD
jgi:nucleotide-binding universal stress UspA family protein